MPLPITILIVEDQDSDFLDMGADVRDVCESEGLIERSEGDRAFQIARARNVRVAREKLAEYATQRPPLIAVFDIRIAPIDPKETAMDDFIVQKLTDDGSYLKESCIIIYSEVHRSQFKSPLRELLRQNRLRISVMWKLDSHEQEEWRAAIRSCLHGVMASEER